MTIPPRLIRTVPAETSAEVEKWWADACAMHPSWEHVTYRDPIDPAWFPLTSAHWHRCVAGAQLAGLIRLEALFHGGGIYLDSDVEVFRSLEPLRQVEGFAAYEDPGVIPDAILGSRPDHPAIAACIALALERLVAHSGRWQTDGPWGTGPGVTTTVLPGRDDWMLFGPQAFYAIHYSEKERLGEPPKPWEFARHHWRHSWA